MYRCEICQELSQPGEGCNLLVVKRRPKTYGREDGSFTTGWEIVKEIRCHAQCKEQWLEQNTQEESK
jgi:hypothetical protein